MVRRSKKARKKPAQPSSRDTAETEQRLFELTRHFCQEAERNYNQADLLTANVLLALREARRTQDMVALAQLESGGRRLLGGPWARGFPANKAAKTQAKDRLITVITEAITYWLPLPGGGTRRLHPWRYGYNLRDLVFDDEGNFRIRPTDGPPLGFSRRSVAGKMAVYINHFALTRHRWRGVLPPLPSDRVEVLARVIEREMEFGRLEGPENTRALCMKMLAAFGMSKTERDKFIGFLKMRRRRRTTE